MTKAKVTNKGNVQVTMSHDQFLIIHNLMNHVRLVAGSLAKEEVFRFLDDLDEFVMSNYIDGDDFTYAVSINDKPEQYSDFTIELGDANE